MLNEEYFSLPTQLQEEAREIEEDIFDKHVKW